MRRFEFLEPISVKEASEMLVEYGETSRLMAGGTALMLVMRQRMLMPSHVISLANIDSLRGVSFDPATGLRIGGLARHCDVARSDDVRRHYPMLAYMASHMANPQVRNQGTIAGNLCYGDPSTDPPTCLMALRASVVLESARGKRVLPIEAFLVDFFATDIQPDEVLAEVLVPPPLPQQTGQYERYRRTLAEHRPLVNVAIALERDGDQCRSARVVVGASTPVPARVAKAEALIAGRTVTPSVIAEFADVVSHDILAISDSRGSEAYRREIAGVVASRALATIFSGQGAA